MELRNPLTTPRGDARYERIEPPHMDGFDNAIDYIDLGAAADYRAFRIEYAVVLPVSGRSQTGVIEISHDGATASVNRHAYSFDEPEITGLDFTARIDAGIVQLVFQKSAVGEDPTLYYSVRRFRTP